MIQILKQLAPALVLGALLSVPAICQPEHPLNNQASPVTVSLSTDTKSVSPSQKIKVTILVQMQPDWHIYYKDHGQTGLPTQVIWNLPSGFVAGPLQWQPPETFVESGIKTFGYKNTTRISADIVAPSQLQRGQKCRIAATVKWLACKHSCIPGVASIALTLPIR